MEFSKSMILKLSILMLILNNSALAINSVGNTTYEGVTKDKLPSYYTFNGQNAIKAPLVDRKDTIGIDYFIRLWIKPIDSFNVTGTTNDNGTQVIFELEKTFKCQFQYVNTLACMKYVVQTQDDFISLSRINNLTPGMWLHLAVGASKSLKKSFIRADYSDQMLKQQNSTYIAMVQAQSPWNAFIGGNNQLIQGFNGAIREFLFTEEFVNPNQVQIIKNSYISFNLKQIGYYRLMQGDLKDNSRGNLTGILVQQSTKTSLPSWSYDTIPNDICYQSSNLISTPRLDNLTADIATIDTRMLTTYPTIQYSASIWLRTKPGMTEGTTYKDSLLVFQLQGVFGLWFSASTQMRIMIFAKKNSYSQSTIPIFIPVDKWVNVQFTLDKTAGYEVRVYDIHRRLIFNITEKVKLQEQTPAAKVTLFSGFKGYIKSIMIYQSKKTLPILQTIGESADSNDTGLILYHKFDKVNFVNSTIISLAKTAKGVAGASVKVTGTINFEYVNWIENNDFNETAKLLGTLNQTDNYFDGVSCINQNIDYGFIGQSSYISHKIPQIAQVDLYEATVELWFRRNTASSIKNYLLSLYSVAENKEYFAIYQLQNSSILTCKIFQDVPDKSLDLDIVNQSQYISKWQHIACKFSSKKHFAAIYHNQEKQHQIKAFFDEDISILGDLKISHNGVFELIIGNSKDKVDGQALTIIKEVRLWTISREYYQIDQYLWTQTDPKSSLGLIGYYRLNQGDFNFTNFMTLPSQQATFNKIEPQYNLTRFLNCPLNTYPNYQGKICIKNPYKQISLNLFTQYSTDNETISWLITSAYSDQYQQFTNKEGLSYMWSTPNQTLTSFLIASQSQQLQTNSLQISSEFISNITNDNKTFVLYHEATNQQRTFAIDDTKPFKVDQCRYLIDKSTSRSINSKTLTEREEQDDLVFQFWIYNKTDCITNEQILFDQITVDSYPSFMGLSNIQVNYNSDDDCFELIIPSNQYTLIPNYEFATFLITVYFGNGNIKTPGSLLNLVYQIKFVDTIEINFNNVDTALLLGDELNIDASETHYIYDSDQLKEKSDKIGLNFIWQCPEIFSELCSSYNGKKQLKLTSDDFTQYEGLSNIYYEFKLIVSSQFDPYQDFQFEKSISIIWQSFNSPLFEFGLKDKDKIMVAEDNTFQIQLQNYDPSLPNIIIDWIIVPSINEEFIEFSEFDTILNILEGGLVKLQKYSITVIVNNTDTDDLSSSLTHEFTTGYGNLLEAQVLVSPLQGYASNTTFGISLTNWHSDYLPITFQLIGLAEGGQDPFDISDQTYDVSQGYSGQLPSMIKLYVYISDSRQTAFTKEFEVSIVIYEEQPPIDERTVNLQQQMDTLNSQAIKAANYSTSATVTDKATLESKLQILFNLSSIATQSSNEDEDDQSTYNKLLTSKSMEIMKLLSNNTVQMNHTIATLTLDILQLIASSKNQAVLKLIQNDNIFNKTSTAPTTTGTNFTWNYIYLISSLNKYGSEKLQFIASGRRRMLYQNTMNINDLRTFQRTIRSEKQNFQDKYCQQMQQFSTQQTFDTYSFKLIFDNFLISTTNFSQRIYTFNSNAISNVYIAQLLNQTKQNFSSATSLCLQGIYFYTSPVQSYDFSNQSLLYGKYIQFTSIDNLGNKLLSDSNDGLIPLASSGITMISTQFLYNFNLTSNKFINNQTVCMQIKDSIVADQQSNGARWDSGTCETQYNAFNTQPSIVCKCKSISSGFYAIVNDYSRIQIIDGSESKTNGAIDDSDKDQLNYSVIIVIAFLCAFGILMFIIAACLDRRDSRIIQKESPVVDKNLLMKVSQKSKQPFKAISFRQLQLAKYTSYYNLSCCTTLNAVYSDLHPLFNIFSYFDVTFLRLSRVILLLYQIGLIAAINLIIFTVAYNQNRYTSNASLTSSGPLKDFLILGLVLSLILLPLPQCFLSCMKKRLKIDKSYQYHSTSSQQKHSYQSQTTVSKINNNNTYNTTSNAQNGAIAMNSHNSNNNGALKLKEIQEQQKQKKLQQQKQQHEGGESEESESENDGVSRVDDEYVDDNEANGIDIDIEAESYQQADQSKNQRKKKPEIMIHNVSDSLQKINSSDKHMDFVKKDSYSQSKFQSKKKDGPLAIDMSKIPEKKMQDKPTQEDLKMGDYFSSQRNNDDFHDIHQIHTKAQITERSMRQQVSDRAFVDKNRGNKNSGNEVVIVDMNFGCKLFLLILILLGYLTLIVMLGIICSGMSVIYQQLLTISFFISLGAGWLVLNPLRIFIISMILKPVVLNERKSVKRKSCCLRFWAFFFINDDARFMMKDIITVNRQLNQKSITKTQQELKIKSSTVPNTYAVDTVMDGPNSQNPLRDIKRQPEKYQKNPIFLTFENVQSEDHPPHDLLHPELQPHQQMFEFNNHFDHPLHNKDLQNSHSRVQSDGPLNDDQDYGEEVRMRGGGLRNYGGGGTHRSRSGSDSYQSLSLTPPDEIITSNRYDDTKRKTAIPESIIMFDHNKFEDLKIGSNSKNKTQMNQSSRLSNQATVHGGSQANTMRQPQIQGKKHDTMRQWTNQFSSPNLFQEKDEEDEDEEDLDFERINYVNVQDEDGIYDPHSLTKNLKRTGMNDIRESIEEFQEDYGRQTEQIKSPDTSKKIIIQGSFTRDAKQNQFSHSKQQQSSQHKMNFENEPEISELKDEYSSQYIQDSDEPSQAAIQSSSHKQQKRNIDLTTSRQSEKDLDSIDRISEDDC